MYMFSRTRRAVTARLPEAIEAGARAAEKVTEVTGNDIHLWAVRFGRPLGTLMWSTRLESQAELMAANEKMAVDPGYLEMAASFGDLFEGEGEDRLVRLVSGTPSPAPKRYLAITEASMAEGKYREAMAWGAEMQAFVAEQSGLVSVFGAATYGGFADLVWLLGADSMEELDRFDDWRMATAEYHDRIHAATGLFVESSGQNGLIEKLN